MKIISVLMTLIFTISAILIFKHETDNGKIVFASQSDGDYEIYTINPDGSELTQLTSNNIEDSYPDWSPDGNQIVFSSHRSGTTEIYIMNSDGTNQHSLTTASNSFAPAWSPDGTKIAYVSYGDSHSDEDIFIMNVDGSDQMNLTSSSRALDQLPSWSPDGRITFRSTRDAELDPVSPHYDIYVMNVDGSNQLYLAYGGPELSRVSWSPDGTKILYSLDTLYDRLYTANSDGTNEIQLALPEGIVSQPSRSSSGEKLVFITGSTLAIANYDGSEPVYLTEYVSSALYPAWQPKLWKK